MPSRSRPPAFNPNEYAASILKQQVNPLDPVEWASKKAKIKLWSKQRDIIRSVKENRRTAVQSGHGVGKLQERNTPHWCPDGRWRTTEEISVGDNLYDEQGKITKVVGLSPWWKQELYRITFDDGSTLDSGQNHEWHVIDLTRRSIREGTKTGVTDWRDYWHTSVCKTTEEMFKEGIKTTANQYRWKIPTARPLQMPNRQLPIHPYLLGFWLGDGSTGKSGITIGDSKLHLLNWLDYQEIKYTLRSDPAHGSHYVYLLDKRDAFRSIGLGSEKKFIPREYLISSEHQRRELLAGLMDSDGFSMGKSLVGIDLTNKRLFDDMYHLLMTLGIKVSKAEGESAYTLDGKRTVTGTRYRMNYRPLENPFKIRGEGWENTQSQRSRHTQRTIVSIKPIGTDTSRCIEVDSPSHLYLTGKSLIPTHNSLTASVTAAWWVDSHPPDETLVVTTAPSVKQVHAILWEEIRKIHQNAGLPGEVQRSDNWIIGNRLVGFGRKPQDHDKNAFQGLHRKYVLVIIDEAAGIDEWLWGSARDITTGEHCRILAIGNPTDPSSYFRKVCRPDSGWNVIKISIFDSPNFTNEVIDKSTAEDLTNAVYVEEARKDLGEGSPMWKARVEGEFPDVDEFSVIPLGWIMQAQERWNTWKELGGIIPADTRKIVGADIARFGGDKTAFVDRWGDLIINPRAIARMDTQGTADLLAAELVTQRGDLAVVDTNGVGAGVYDRLKRIGKYAQPLNVGNRTSLKDTSGQIEFYNLRAAAFWKLREALDPARNPTIMLPDDEQLAGDLSTPHWKTIPGGKILIESKDEIRKRINRSPDKGDALVLAWWAGPGGVMLDYDQAAFPWSSGVEENDAVVWQQRDNESVFNFDSDILLDGVPEFDWI